MMNYRIVLELTEDIYSLSTKAANDIINKCYTIYLNEEAYGDPDQAELIKHHISNITYTLDNMEVI